VELFKQTTTGNVHDQSREGIHSARGLGAWTYRERLSFVLGQTLSETVQGEIVPSTFALAEV